MIPTIEEVKEYFKDAEVVNCLLCDSYYPIIESIFLDENEYWCDALNSNDKILLWKENEYAEILSTKQPYIKIQLSEIRNTPNDAELGKLVRMIAENY